MKETRDLLISDYKKVTDLLSVVPESDTRQEQLMKERDNIRQELIKLDSAATEMTMRGKELAEENRREKIRNGITITTFIVSTCVSVYAIVRTFRFDENGTVTSTLGRGILNGIVPRFK